MSTFSQLVFAENVFSNHVKNLRLLVFW